jgi:hypothetical protein
MWTGFIWLRCGAVTGFSEYGNKLSIFIKEREFLDQMSEDWLLKKDPP